MGTKKKTDRPPINRTNVRSSSGPSEGPEPPAKLRAQPGAPAPVRGRGVELVGRLRTRSHVGPSEGREPPAKRLRTRFLLWRLAGIRLAMRLLARIAPGAAEAWALRLWSTPRRPRPARPPEVPELAARAVGVQVQGLRLAAWAWGRGPTVLLVHGWSGYASQMAAFVAPLVAAGFQVVAFDQPSHGQSEGSRSHGPLMRDAVLAVAAQVGPVHALVAHSLGATAAVLALTAGLAAERVVLVAPPAETSPFARAFAAALGLSSARTAGMLERARRMVGVDLSALDLRGIAPRMRAALLVVHDTDDRDVPFAHGQAIAAAWPGGRLRVTNGFGHVKPLRRPEIVQEVVDFVGGRKSLDATAS
jgi:pimeloyl-ACP methyl ester carboxylesterase